MAGAAVGDVLCFAASAPLFLVALALRGLATCSAALAHRRAERAARAEARAAAPRAAEHPL